METLEFVQVCTCIFIKYSERSNLCEYEVLLYEEACRTLETYLKGIRQALEVQDESENFKR